MHVVAGFTINRGAFTCPVFNTKHQIDMTLTNIGSTAVHMIKYRGHTYFLERYLNENKKKMYYKFGLVEERKQGFLMRDISSMAEDLSHRYLYNVLGERVVSENLKRRDVRGGSG
jgi:hypothetical protein